MYIGRSEWPVRTMTLEIRFHIDLDPGYIVQLAFKNTWGAYNQSFFLNPGVFFVIVLQEVRQERNERSEEVCNDLLQS